jgi:3-hydroxyisobutyrate dehydrogenase-like beta-hydroxyacid dehydrogenase
MRDAGAALHLFDPNKVALAPFVAKAAQAHASPAGVAGTARIGFACLPSGAISRMVAREAASGSVVRIYVDMSTIGGAARAKVQAIVEARGITPGRLPEQRRPQRRQSLHIDCNRRRTARRSR